MNSEKKYLIILKIQYMRLLFLDFQGMFCRFKSHIVSLSQKLEKSIGFHYVDFGQSFNFHNSFLNINIIHSPVHFLIAWPVLYYIFDTLEYIYLQLSFSFF